MIFVFDTTEKHPWIVRFPHDNGHNVPLEPTPHLLGHVVVAEGVLKGQVEHVVALDPLDAVFALGLPAAIGASAEYVNLNGDLLDLGFRVSTC